MMSAEVRNITEKPGQSSHASNSAAHTLTIETPESPIYSRLHRKYGKVRVFHVPGSSVPMSVLSSPKGKVMYIPGDMTKDVEDIYRYGGLVKSMGQLAPQTLTKKDVVDVVIRPMDKAWIMGDDWTIRVHLDMKVKYLRSIVEEYKSIPSCRQLLHVLRNERKIEIGNEDWSLRRLGLLPEDIIVVEPTMTSAWLWNPIEYYETRFLEEILKVVDMNNGRISISALNNRLIPPPPIKISLLRFISKYPDQIHVYTDLTSGIQWIQRPRHEYQLPTFSNFSVELESPFQLKLPDFNFDDYADIDDTKPLELDFVIPNVVYNIQIVSANNLMPSAMNTFPNPMCILYFNDLEIGRTSRRAKCLNPEWNDAVFVIEVSPNQNIFDCVVKIEVHDTSASSSGNSISTSLLGCLELRGNDLVEFLCGLYQESYIVNLVEDEEALQLTRSTDILLQSADSLRISSRYSLKRSKFGSITMKGGKSGLEVCVVSAHGLAELPDPRSQVIAIVLWNGNEIGRTFPESIRLQSLVWKETFTIPSNFDKGLSSDFINKLKDSLLEIQVWSTFNKKTLNVADYGITPSNKDSLRDEFLGSITLKGESLVESLASDWPWANIRRGSLQKSFAFSSKKSRKDRVQGNLTFIVGSAGLNVRRSAPLELTMISADDLTIFEKLFYTIEWNYCSIYRSNHLTLKPTSDKTASVDLQNYQCHLEVDNDQVDLSESYLKIEFFESIVSKGYAIYGDYLGCVYLYGQEALKQLFLNKYATITSFPLQRNPNVDGKRQTMIHGSVTLRGGIFGSRTEMERILYVSHCLLNISEMKESSSIYVVVSYMNKVLGRTSAIDSDRKLFWDQENVFLVPLQIPRDGSNSGCDLSIEVCRLNSNHEGKDIMASCRIDSNVLQDFLESFDPMEMAFPLKVSEKTRLHIAHDAEIVLGTCGTKYCSYSEYRNDVMHSVHERISLEEVEEQEHSIEEAVTSAINDPEALEL